MEKYLFNMTHTYSQLYVHIVWSTKKREALILPVFKNRLYAYIREVIKEEKGVVLALNGMPDHVHLLIGISASVYIPDLMRKLKSSTTKWWRLSISKDNSFGWQEGYGVFSVGLSTLPSVIKYIENQEKHHQSISFEDEYLSFLKKNKINYDPRFVLS